MKLHNILCIAYLSIVTTACLGAAVTVDVTIKAVNPQARGITVVYKTELGEKTIELDVSRKAEITVNEKEGTLDSLCAGLKAKVVYDKDLAVVTKIEASGAVVKQKRPELVVVSELNGDAWNSIGCFSQDGLTVYWVQSNKKKFTIWTAHRDDAQSLFVNKKELLPGSTPTVSADGLEMILTADRSDGQKGRSLYVATRSAPDKPFKRPTEISELAGIPTGGGDCLSPDGLTLHFLTRTATDKPQNIVSCTRRDRSATWSNPKPVYNVTADDGVLQSLFVIPDGLSLLCAPIVGPNDTGEKGNLMIWTRPAVGRPFLKRNLIEAESLPPLVCGGATYVSATGELFITRFTFENKKRVRERADIWVVKNFTLPDATK